MKRNQPTQQEDYGLDVDVTRSFEPDDLSLRGTRMFLLREKNCSIFACTFTPSILFSNKGDNL